MYTCCNWLSCQRTAASCACSSPSCCSCSLASASCSCRAARCGGRAGQDGIHQGTNAAHVHTAVRTAADSQLTGRGRQQCHQAQITARKGACPLGWNADCRALTCHVSVSLHQRRIHAVQLDLSGIQCRLGARQGGIESIHLCLQRRCLLLALSERVEGGCRHDGCAALDALLCRCLELAVRGKWLEPYC